MNVTRIQALIICSLMAVVSFWGNDGNSIGVSSQTINAEYNLSGSTNLVAIFVSLILLFFIFNYIPKHQSHIKSKRVPLWRRFIAFNIDFFIALLATAPILSLPIILFEFIYTGQFQWSFARSFERNTDSILALISVLAGMFWLLFYYAYPLVRGRQTIGRFLVGYRIARDLQTPPSLSYAMWHSFKGFLVLCAGCVTVPLAFFDKNKQLLHEGKDTFYAELVSYEN